MIRILDYFRGYLNLVNKCTTYDLEITSDTSNNKVEVKLLYKANIIYMYLYTHRIADHRITKLNKQTLHTIFGQ